MNSVFEELFELAKEKEDEYRSEFETSYDIFLERFERYNKHVTFIYCEYNETGKILPDFFNLKKENTYVKCSISDNNDYIIISNDMNICPWSYDKDETYKWNEERLLEAMNVC